MLLHLILTVALHALPPLVADKVSEQSQHVLAAAPAHSLKDVCLLLCLRLAIFLCTFMLILQLLICRLDFLGSHCQEAVYVYNIDSIPNKGILWGKLHWLLVVKA